MPSEYRGAITKVYDNETSKGKTYWSVVIDTDDKGEVKFNLWDAAYAGGTEDSLCDVHEMIGERVVFTAKAGKIKDEATGEHWPSTIESICAEEPMPDKSVRELAQELEEDVKAATQHVENHTARSVGVNHKAMQIFIEGVREAADTALATLELES